MMKIKVNEIFGPTIQGEGSNTGLLCHFIRLAGCDQTPKCRWCDTDNAYNKKSGIDMEYEDIVEKLINLCSNYSKIRRIIFTGGNPCIQDLTGLIPFIKNSFNNNELEFCIETQGTVFPEYLDDFDHIVISPKPPSSSIHNQGQNCDNIIKFIKNHKTSNIELKIVVFDMNDLLWAQNIFKLVDDKENNDHLYFTIQIGTVNDNFISSINKNFKRIKADNIIQYLYSNECVLSDNFLSKVRILPQVHKILNVQ